MGKRRNLVVEDANIKKGSAFLLVNIFSGISRALKQLFNNNLLLPNWKLKSFLLGVYYRKVVFRMTSFRSFIPPPLPFSMIDVWPTELGPRSARVSRFPDHSDWRRRRGKTNSYSVSFWNRWAEKDKLDDLWLLTDCEERWVEILDTVWKRYRWE